MSRAAALFSCRGSHTDRAVPECPTKHHIVQSDANVRLYSKLNAALRVAILFYFFFYFALHSAYRMSFFFFANGFDEGRRRHKVGK